MRVKGREKDNDLEETGIYKQINLHKTRLKKECKKKVDLKKTAEIAGNERGKNEERRRSRGKEEEEEDNDDEDDEESSCKQDRLPECFTKGDGASNFNNWIQPRLSSCAEGRNRVQRLYIGTYIVAPALYLSSSLSIPLTQIEEVYTCVYIGRGFRDDGWKDGRWRSISRNYVKSFRGIPLNH